MHLDFFVFLALVAFTVTACPLSSSIVALLAPRGFFAFRLLAVSSALEGPRLRAREGARGEEGGPYLALRVVGIV